ncbi:SIMPL domain-containing protein [Patescibacteria group bacterium]|nr:SIMPL domain-containing protein [Patescibacteria group bacterium]
MEFDEPRRPVTQNPWEPPTPPIPPVPPVIKPEPVSLPTEPLSPVIPEPFLSPIQPPKPSPQIPVSIFVMMFVIVLAALSLVLINTWVQPEHPREITVQGTGIAYSAPDVAKIDFGVRSEAKNLADSQRNNADAIAKIKNDLAGFDIQADDIQTINYNINPDYLYYGSQKPRLTGYTTYHFLRLTIRKLDTVDAILQTLGYSGVTDISQISFTIDDTAEIKSEARERAIADAKTLAEQITNLSDTKLGKITSIQEESTNNDNTIQPLGGYGGGGDGNPGVEQGSLSITSTVTLTYALK